MIQSSIVTNYIENYDYANDLESDRDHHENKAIIFPKKLNIASINLMLVNHPSL